MITTSKIYLFETLVRMFQPINNVIRGATGVLFSYALKISSFSLEQILLTFEVFGSY